MSISSEWKKFKKKTGISKVEKEVSRALRDFDEERRRAIGDVVDFNKAVLKGLGSMVGIGDKGSAIRTAPPTQLSKVAPATQLKEASAADKSGSLQYYETMRRLARLRRATQVSDLSTPRIKNQKLGSRRYA